ncbi:MAG: hypothetical protein LH647_12845 [Leptolyngbyaceae cyanobacterium CAN_BIN12]|nr:hypothetical protein [Leptolyngbyaceae cyanobacterium CAN_BIN12]
MAYSDFTLEAVVEQFGLVEKNEALFATVQPIPASDWLTETLSISQKLGVRSGTEKARSEFIIVPILLELERRNPNQFMIYSGKSMDVDKSKGLNGECDFILSKGEATRVIQAPIFSLVEAKKQDIDLGLGQCVAQMIGATLFNQQRENNVQTIYGCVTTAEVWQFLKLNNQQLTIDSHLYSLNELEMILGIFQTILDFY